MNSLTRFFNPQSIAVYGGAWAVNVIDQLQQSNYQGKIWPVNPYKKQIRGLKCFAVTSDLPSPPDASFIGVNSEQTIKIVRELAEMQAGGVACFASGFNESHVASAQGLQQMLVEAAELMPVLGPNCYGYLNYLDNVYLWPDQHGGVRVERGVAIITQSSNIAINITMQRTGLPISHMVTVGNQAQLSVGDIGTHLLSDSRVTALGLYIEGFSDIRAYEMLAMNAHALGKPIVALKSGKSCKGQRATVTHTGAVSGNAQSSTALLTRLGIVEVVSIEVMLQTLKLLHFFGPLPSGRIASVSCSGGEASLMADLGDGPLIQYPDFADDQQRELANLLGDRVDLANPLDYHTYIWGDVPMMTACFKLVMGSNVDLTVFVLDVPRSDLCDPSGHDCAVESIIAAKQACIEEQGVQVRVAVLSLLSENLDEAMAKRFAMAGVVTLHGMQHSITAINNAIRAGGRSSTYSDVLSSYVPVLLRQSTQKNSDVESITLDESIAKKALERFGVAVPRSLIFKEYNNSKFHELEPPWALKSIGIAHKTEQGAVILNINTEQELAEAMDKIPNSDAGYLLEEMVQDVVAELLVGVTVDETGLFMMTIGAGGVLAEVLQDTVSLLLPTKSEDIRTALHSLKIAKLLRGYRGAQTVDECALINTIMAVASYAEANQTTLLELDVNPLMVKALGAVAVDALIVNQPMPTIK